MRLGKNERKMFDFAKKYSPEWTGFNTDYQTMRIIDSLVKKGLVVINPFSQFKLNPAVVEQECNDCHKRFYLKYLDNGSYEYICKPCNCESDFSPVDGLSINQYLETIAR
jgi:hypothetical protein